MEALKEGRLDHRTFVFSYGYEFIKFVIKRGEKDGVYPLSHWIFTRMNLIDWREDWTIYDIYNYYPNGDSIEFWRELKICIEERMKEMNENLKNVVTRSREGIAEYIELISDLWDYARNNLKPEN